jgi:hypothetical protein
MSGLSPWGYNLIKKDNLKPSRIIEILVRDYYGNKNL